MSATVVADLDGRYVDVNDEALALFGCTRAEFLAAKIGDFSGPHRELARKVWKRLAPTAGIPTGESTIYRRDGSAVRVHYTRITRRGEVYELELLSLDGDQGPPVADRPSEVLREWRAAERDKDARASREAAAAAEGLRDLYQHSVERRRGGGEKRPPD